MFASRQIVRNVMGKRNFMKSAIRRDDHDHGGIPGKNLPFDINNRFKLTAIMTIFLSTAMVIPFLAVRHQLLK